jgi:hypothetical protein
VRRRDIKESKVKVGNEIRIDKHPKKMSLTIPGTNNEDDKERDGGSRLDDRSTDNIGDAGTKTTRGEGWYCMKRRSESRDNEKSVREHIETGHSSTNTHRLTEFSLMEE